MKKKYYFIFVLKKELKNLISLGYTKERYVT